MPCRCVHEFFFGPGFNSPHLHNSKRIGPKYLFGPFVYGFERVLIFLNYNPWLSSIWHVAIEPEYRGQGYGHMIVAAAEERLRRRGTACIDTYIQVGNTASRRFFASRGYIEYPHAILSMEKTP